MEDLEKFYDTEVAPLIGQAMDICSERGIPAFASVQFSDKRYSVARVSAKGKWKGHVVFEYFSALADCVDGDDVDIDQFMLWLLARAAKRGHNSLLLNELIPTGDRGLVN
jgi:hypothetical protein